MRSRSSARVTTRTRYTNVFRVNPVCSNFREKNKIRDVLFFLNTMYLNNGRIKFKIYA